MASLRTISTTLALSALLIGCSGDDMAATDADAGGESFSADAVEESAQPQDDGDFDTSGDGRAPPSAATAANRAEQRLIRTAELTLEVEDTAGALDEVIATAERAGGFAATSDLQRDADGVVLGSITLRVPAAELNGVVDELEAIGDAVPVNRIDERDVTIESADLRARIDNLTAYEQELLALLAEVREDTTRPEDLLTIFERIRSVREEIDVMQGRLSALDDQVAMSTVRVTLRSTASATAVSEAEWAPAETFRDALAATGRALADIADAAIWIVVTAIPVAITILIIPAVLLVLLIRWTRARGRDRRAGAGSAPPPPSTPPATSADPPAAPTS